MLGMWPVIKLHINSAITVRKAHKIKSAPTVLVGKGFKQEELSLSLSPSFVDDSTHTYFIISKSVPKIRPSSKKNFISDAQFQTGPKDFHTYKHSKHQKSDKKNKRDIVFQFLFNRVSGDILGPSKISKKKHIHINVPHSQKFLAETNRLVQQTFFTEFLKVERTRKQKKPLAQISSGNLWMKFAVPGKRS
jgi:hypothetical protein